MAWGPVQEYLDSQDGHHATFHYRKEGSKAGQPLSLTIGGQAERIDANSESPSIRESCSFVYHCFEGSGSTTLALADGTSTEVQWSKGDTFAVPAWTARVHKGGNERSYLFAINDLPLLQNLGMYRKE